MEAPVANAKCIRAQQGRTLLHAQCRPKVPGRIGHALQQHRPRAQQSSLRVLAQGASGRIGVVVNSSKNPVVFFVDTASTEEFRLDLEPQQLLGLAPGEAHKDSDVNQAYDGLLSVQLEGGYSQQIAGGRAEVLEIARGVILAGKRIPLDKRDRDITLPYELLPACLALLAELGHSELTLFLGGEVCANGALDSYPSTKSDVLLSMALAKCNMAREEFAASTQVAAGCQHLEEALQLLQPKGSAPVAPELAREVRTSLAQLAGQCALEQMSGPVTKEQSEERRRAVRTIRELLRHPDTSSDAAPGGPITHEFIAKLMPLLTTEEVVHLQEWATIARNSGAYKWVYPGLLERVAIGHILLGYQQCQPAYIKMAVQLLKQLPPSSEVLAAQAVCQLLLGAVHSSLELLRQAEVAGARAPRTPATAGDAPSSAQAYAYVQEHTPAGEDGLLPGLCQYTQLWLARAAAPLFRGPSDAAPLLVSLTQYFDNTRVEALITVYDEKGDGKQLADSLQGVVDNLRQGVGRWQEAARTSLEATGANSSIKMPELPAAVSDLPFISDLPRNLNTPLARKIAAPAAAAVGLLALALVLWPRGGQDVKPRAATLRAPVASDASASRQLASKQQQAVKDTSGSLQPKVIDQVLKVWQEVKSQALGPEYDGTRLQEVLAEPVLSEMRKKITHFKKEGIVMKYKLNRIKVKDVDSSQADGRVQVVATLDESCAMYVEGSEADSYKNTYDVTYEFVKSKDGVWRVAVITYS